MIMQGLSKENPIDILFKGLFFFLSPFISCIYSILNMKTKSSLLVFFVFCLFFGMGYTTESGKDDEVRNDGAVYRMYFEDYISNYSETDFKEELKDILLQKSYKKDIYFLTVAYYVSQKTNNYHVLFFVFALIFGFFMVMSLKILIEEENFRISVPCIFLTALFLINGIQNINGMRFWTAAWIATYSLLQLQIYGRKIFYVLLLITPLFHASFIFLIIIFLIYLLLGDEKSRWIYAFYGSFIFSVFASDILSNFVQIPGLDRFSIYLSEEVFFRMEGQKGFLRRFFDLTSFVYVNILFYLIYIEVKDKKTFKGKKVYDFFIVYFTFVNFVRPIPSLGPRYLILSFPFLAYLWLVVFGDCRKKFFIYIMPITMLWYFHNTRLLYSIFLERDFYLSNPFLLVEKYLQL